MSKKRVLLVDDSAEIRRASAALVRLSSKV